MHALLCTQIFGRSVVWKIAHAKRKARHCASKVPRRYKTKWFMSHTGEVLHDWTKHSKHECPNAHNFPRRARSRNRKKTKRYVEQLDTLKSQEKSIARNAQVVEQMYALLAQYDVKAPSEDMVQVDDLRTMQVRGALVCHRIAVSCSAPANSQ